MKIQGRSRSAVVLAALALGGLVLAVLPAGHAEPEFWNGPDGWAYRKAVTITYNGSAVTNIQIPMSVPTASLISAGKMQSDCGDLRFATPSGTLVPFWLESGCGGNANVWVRVPTLSTGTTMLDMYYGNPSAPSTSQTNTTFVGNRTWVEQSNCLVGGEFPSCPINNHADADAYRDVPATCAVSRFHANYGDPCAATSFNTDTNSLFYSEYHFIFVPDVTGTWEVQWIAGWMGELVVSETDEALYHSMTRIAMDYTTTSVNETHTATRAMTAGKGEWYSFLVSEWYGNEGSRVSFKRPGGSFLPLTTTNFPGLYFRRDYLPLPAPVSIGSEQGLPSAPLNVNAVAGPGAGQITVDWDVPSSNGGSTIAGYHVFGSTDGLTFTLAANTSAPPTVFSGLSPGATHYYKVAAYTTRGLGSLSARDNATTFQTPTAPPGSLVFSAGTNHSLQVTWSLPSNDGGTPITNYRIYRGTTTTTTYLGQTGGANRSFFDAGPLTNGVTYYYNVTAENLVGQGASSIIAGGIPGEEPYPPGSPSAQRGDGHVNLTWPAALANGPPVDNYQIDRLAGEVYFLVARTGGANTSFRVNGLTNGVDYTFLVSAHNSYGWSNLSAPITARPARAPDAPTLDPLVVHNASVDILGSAPANDGGEPVSYYDLYTGPNAGALTLWGGIRGLGINWPSPNGQQICVAVAAVNTVGPGPLSTTRCGTPLGRPYPPAMVAVVAANGTLTPSWTTPFDDNSGITGYRVWNGTTIVCTTAFGVNSCTIPGLRVGYTYTYNVTAYNAVGNSATSDYASKTPASVPYPPSSLVATRQNQSVALSWIAPYDQASAITSYTVWNGTTLVKTVTAPAVSTTITGLANGYAYTYNVTATNAIGRGNPSNFATATPGAIPNPVGGVVAQPGNRSVSLSWAAPASHGYAILDYDVYDGGTPVATVATPSYVHSGLTNGIDHSYTVSARNAIGHGNFSAAALARPVSFPDQPVLTATRGDQRVDLAWTTPYDQGSPITSYRVWNGTSVVATVTGNAHALLGLQNGFTYTYNVTAINAVGASVSSNLASAKPAGLPIQPTFVTAASSNRSVNIQWSGALANGEPITAYKLYRGGPSAASLLATLSPTNSTFVDAGLTNGVSYTYNVSPVNAVGEGISNIFASATPRSIPNPPQLVAATRGDASVSLTWVPGDAQGSPVCAYDVYRGTSPSGTRSRIAQITGGTGCTPALSHHDAPLANGIVYYYNVTAINDLGRSVTSNTMSARPATLPSAPLSPVALFRNGGADFHWSAPSSNGGETIIGYHIYTRADGAGVANRTGPMASSSPTVVSGLANGVTYWLSVTAVNAVGEGPRSAEVNVTPARAPDAPANLSLTPSSRQVRLAWDVPPFDGGRPITGYRLAWSDESGPVGSDDIGTNRSYLVAQLVDGRTYSFTVAARNLVGIGATTPSLAAMPYGPPGAPTITSVTTLSPTSTVTLNWNAPTTDGGRPIALYRVFASNAPGGERYYVDTVPATSTSYADEIPAGAARTYVVVATNEVGDGPASAEATGSRLPDPLAPMPETYRSCSRDPNTRVVTCTAGSQTRVDEISAGGRHTCARLSDGRVDCWGDNTFGQAADHASGRPVMAIAAGGAHTCALLDDGRVDCWGANTHGQARPLLDVGATQISAGDTHTCILRADSSVVCQGSNSYGESVGRAGGVLSVSAGGHHTCFLLVNNSVDCQGRNAEGQAADAWTQDVDEVSTGGYHTCFRRASGVTCQGDIRSVPTELGTSATQLASGAGHTCALRALGDAICWGARLDGQSAGYTLTDAVAIEAGDTHTCVLTAAGTVRCWGATGATNYGQAQAYPLAAETFGGGSTAGTSMTFEARETRAITTRRTETK